jgi:hypothetical protein
MNGPNVSKAPKWTYNTGSIYGHIIISFKICVCLGIVVSSILVLFCFVRLRLVSYVPNVVSFSGLSIRDFPFGFLLRLFSNDLSMLFRFTDACCSSLFCVVCLRCVLCFSGLSPILDCFSIFYAVNFIVLTTISRKNSPWNSYE